jgi:hypothetical protein
VLSGIKVGRRRCVHVKRGGRLQARLWGVIHREGRKSRQISGMRVIQPNGGRDHVTDRRECVRPLAAQAWQLYRNGQLKHCNGTGAVVD